MNIIRIKETTSTNVELSEMIVHKPLDEGTVLAAENQTSGRGQAGNSWESEPGKNLLFSVLLYPNFLELQYRFLLSELTANSVKQVLDKFTDYITIKWPNDIYYKDEKIAGILIENSLTNNIITQSIVGMGVNVNQEVFLSDAPNPVSLKQILGRDIDLHFLLTKIVDRILSAYEDLRKGDYDSIKRYYYESLYRKSGLYVFSDKNGQFNAKIDSVADDGVLSLITESGEIRKYLFKEVSFVF